jgi:hypothetical protein
MFVHEVRNRVGLTDPSFTNNGTSRGSLVCRHQLQRDSGFPARKRTL